MLIIMNEILRVTVHSVLCESIIFIPTVIITCQCLNMLLLRNSI
jgi:hypothetical protein